MERYLEGVSALSCSTSMHFKFGREQRQSILYTVTLSIAQKVLLHASLLVPFGCLAELQPPFSQASSVLR